MSVGLPESNSDAVMAAVDRLEQLERGLSHTIAALRLGLADFEISDEQPTVEQEMRLQNAAATLLRIASTSLTTAQNVAPNLLPAETKPNLYALPVTTLAPLPQPIPAPLPATSPETVAKTPPPAQKPREKEQARHQEGPLYKRIISARQVPNIIKEGMAPIEITAVDDETIIVGNQRITLTGDVLFTFNAFLLKRQGYVQSRDVRGLGFRAGASEAVIAQNCTKAMVETMNLVNEAGAAVSERPLIMRIGERAATKYAINPAIVFKDAREIPSDDDAEGVKKN